MTTEKPAPAPDGRRLTRRETKPPARGTRSTSTPTDPGAPVVSEPPYVPAPAATPAPPAPTQATLPAAKPPPKWTEAAGVLPSMGLMQAPAPGRTVPKSVAPARKPPVPTPFPPPELKAECEALLARYPQRLAALIPILHLAQRRLGGFIGPELEAGIANYLGCSDQHVRGVLTFYTMFNTKPVGRHHLQVCRTLSCALRGADDLKRCIERKTGLKPGQTGADGRFTVSEVECLGLCEEAPAIFVNDTAHAHLSPKDLEALLERLT